VAFRRWRRDLLRSWRSGEFGRFKKELQEEHYDLVIDAQGLIKSGIISRISKGLTVGLSNHTIREPLATLFYNVMYTVPWQQHAVERVRDLFSRTFNYSLDYKSCDYGLDTSGFLGAEPEKEDSLVFFHGTTWESKKWPEQYWQGLAAIAGENGYKVKIPWGNAEEHERARRIAAGSSNVEIIGNLTLTDVARILMRARAVVAVDTGLAHLAAALGLPVVSLYGSSDPELTGTYGRSQLHLKSAFSCSPCLDKQCQYGGEKPVSRFHNKSFVVNPPCYSDNPPEQVWQRVNGLIAGGAGSLDSLFY
ncbi:MAG: lipopolysaccharide heptosyltransferase I, partial [Pseudohongiellaceae bacterium]